MFELSLFVPHARWPWSWSWSWPWAWRKTRCCPVALNLEEEVLPTGEQHVEEPILEEQGVAQPRGDDAPPPPPLLSEVMDCQTHLMETLAEGLLRHNGGLPNDFQRKLEGFLKLRPPTFDSLDDDPIVAED